MIFLGQVLAEAAAKAVVVEYTNQKPAITTIAEAIAAGSLYDHVKGIFNSYISFSSTYFCSFSGCTRSWMLELSLCMQRSLLIIMDFTRLSSWDSIDNFQVIFCMWSILARLFGIHLMDIFGRPD